MKKRKNFLIISFVAIITLFLIAAIYFVKNQPINITKELINKVNESHDGEKYLSENFLNKIKEDSPSTKEYLDSAVSNYSVEQRIKDINIIERSSDSIVAEVTVKTETKNNKSGFTVNTIDRYKVSIIKESGNWKIDNYKLVESQTQKNDRRQ